MNACFQKDFPRDVCEMKHRVVMRIDAFRHSFCDLLTHALQKNDGLIESLDTAKVPRSKGLSIVYYLLFMFSPPKISLTV